MSLIKRRTTANGFGATYLQTRLDRRSLAQLTSATHWEALGEADIADALCATSYGGRGVITSPHLGFGERDCLAFLADGRRDQEIAGLLGITETTVRFHLDRARRKLGARNRAQAIARLANLRLL